MNKHIPKIEDAIADIEDGAMIAIGGFFSAGVPRQLLRALIEKGTRNLTLACGSGPLLTAPDELQQLIENNQIRKVIDSYGLPRSATKGQDNALEQMVREGGIELEVYPMGTLAEKYRAGGAGIPAFYVPTGAGTVAGKSIISNIPENMRPKETRLFNGQEYILETALRPDFAFVHAHIGDGSGNLQYRKTAGNFNHVMATAAKTTIAEVEVIADVGKLDPERVHTAGIYVQRVVKVPREDVLTAID